MSPLITIGIPTYARPKLVGEAIQSCLAQDFQDFEILVSDDCPTDEIKRVVASFDSPKIRYTRHHSRVNLGKKLNDFLRDGLGEWFVILGDDDTFEPGYLLAMAQTVREHPDAALVRTRCRFIDTEGRFIKLAVDEPARLEPLDFLNIVFLPWYRSFVNITGVLFLRRKLIELGGFLETTYAWNADTAAWAWLGSQGPCYFESRPLVRLRFNTDSAYKKFNPDYQDFIYSKRIFLDSMNVLFKDLSRYEDDVSRRKISRAYKRFMKYWIREETQLRLDDIFIYYLGHREQDARGEVRTLLRALKASGLAVYSPVFSFYRILSFLPRPPRRMLLRFFCKSRNQFWKAFPPERWAFFKKSS